MSRRFLKKVVCFLVILLLFMVINNTNLFMKQSAKEPSLLAHRGLAQTFEISNVKNDTCTAEMIHKPEHPFLENTILSMEAAFSKGADLVEFDIKPTKDGQFAVFHDWTLDCRTNVQGTPLDYTMDELKMVDIGYGYTYDNGKTFPFRGKGIGLMPSLDEVLSYFPEKSFLLHIKSNDAKEGEQLARVLTTLPEAQLSLLSVYGGDEPIAALRAKLPSLRVMSKETMKSCLIPYILVGWTGYVPDACENTQLHLPEKIAPFLWGWSGKFISRMEKSNTRVIVVAGDGGFSEGFDSANDLERLPANYNGWIWTNRIDTIAPLIQNNKIE
ncbi:glycerophosphodiester phosphodiesterase family protein [Metabacillus litoralis]|jgi:glycerophosphoryl diester phosphodiesterase|uniref:glycerophosphodiester phosphodiesterase family protein n=1 Tax=Metabacillus litoralis TaxID=152268 RepID=UPI00203EE124|nr:glycerophosphodiester phosphodiesterase family protein [Metabacillus litoralis]MCM3650775.1 glycerophosphodiester phosphodiesterase [Metabacillus litoralis]